MNFKNAFISPQSIQVCHLRSKILLTTVDRLRGQPRLIQRGRWPPRMVCWHSSSPPWPCAQQVAAAARRNATTAHEGEGKGEEVAAQRGVRAARALGAARVRAEPRPAHAGAGAHPPP